MAGNSAKPEKQQPVTVPVFEEQLSVGTRKVDTGGIRIHKTVAEHPVTLDERLLRDETVVEHVPVDRFVAPGEAPTTRYEGDTLVVPVLEEVLVVERRVRIKEELHITRVRREQRHLETVMLKSEQVAIERLDGTAEPPTK
jgi:uncharacterized protein (TIGR02271 family)